MDWQDIYLIIVAVVFASLSTMYYILSNSVEDMTLIPLPIISFSKPFLFSNAFTSTEFIRRQTPVGA
jgi:hypothetical protein